MKTLRAHPRSRGEHAFALSPFRCGRGSSPLARGTPCSIVKVSASGGLIPARAGNTGYPSFWLRAWRAHPRSRGEHTGSLGEQVAAAGSSPLARGTRGAGGASIYQPGLIPARAGNTMTQRTAQKVLRAHPRSRGEHRGTAYQEHFHWGSSPLARGTPPFTVISTSLIWLIPARAGNTGGLRR